MFQAQCEFVKRWGLDTFDSYFNRDSLIRTDEVFQKEQDEYIAWTTAWIDGIPPPPRLISESKYNDRYQHSELNPFRHELRDIDGNAVPEPIAYPCHLVWPEKKDYTFDTSDISFIENYIRENGVLMFMLMFKYKYSLVCLIGYRGVADAQLAYIEKLKREGKLIG